MTLKMTQSDQAATEAVDQPATSPDRSRSSSLSDDVAPATASLSTAISPRIQAHPVKNVECISVSDPIQFNEGIKGKYTVYRVSYDSELEDAETPFLAHPTSTQHRFSSFVTLYNLLAKEKPGAILPPLPDKLIKDRFSAACLEDRRFHLELFMRRCVMHPEVRDSAILKSFFDESNWKRVKQGHVDVAENEDALEQYEEPKATEKTSKKSSIKKWIKDKKTSLSGSLHRSPLDPLFEEMEHYISALESGLRRVESQAEQMVKSAKQGGSMWVEFGLGCDAVGHVDDFIGAEPTTASRGSSGGDGKQTIGQTFHQTSQTADALSTLHQTHHQTLILNFLLPLRDHLKMIHAAKSALTKRSNRRITYSTALANVDSKKGVLHKYRITQGMENKVLNAEASLSKAEAEVETAKQNYDEVSERVLREFDRFKNENAAMMHITLIEFGRVQFEYSDEVARVWRGAKIGGEVGSSGRCYVDAARVLLAANISGGGHLGGMPMYPPPPVPEGDAQVNALENGVGTIGIQGAVRYRDPLPEE